ncbi:MAG: protein-methionine-sulfoxide reductase catalytic subunit MsrP [Alphaproteobacteria bacterium]
MTLPKIFFQQKPEWQLPEKDATPEALWLDYQQNRRKFLRLSAGSIGGALASGVWGINNLARADAALWQQKAKIFYPSRKNLTYDKAKRFPITSEFDATRYNNFYEIGSDKAVWRGSDSLQPYPWTVRIDGMVDNPKTFDVLDLIKKMGIETRVYRLRCVEAWSMTVPWVGFPLKKMLQSVGVKSGAKYVAFYTKADKETMPGLRQVWYPWPYREGLTIAEAMHDLSFMVVGAYDKPLPNQNGAPLRLALPWKYGFKSIKSIERITLTSRKPKTFWSDIASNEYGFYANVNPKYSHPRWSQATERVLGKGKERVPTLKYNGYGRWIAGIYKNLPQTRELFF